ncbi:PD-(D/E)XK nuclease family protein [Glaciimonas soli]|uniref:PD-(D/E)XK nuclease family protein n=1 Tax=Glaciimonas soli TaxID=2590999 RepID=A0A843YV55_9BURK|nr:PD-(D/E)XK nuclease family protein [Glaciimonas soli]MQR01877.1 PD-(D/E)XK nuclease family protein [Glaciimonas soli]
MPSNVIHINPSTTFWRDVARALLAACHDEPVGASNSRDCSNWRVIVPTFAHAQQLKAALAAELGGVFIPPRISTLSTWLEILPPLSRTAAVSSSSERLMRLYAELRQHAWLKKLFSARRNTDLLPLAQTLLALSDELTQALLPSLRGANGLDNTEELEQRWQHALEQLSPGARELLSDEAQLVWSVWKSQLDSDDAIAVRFEKLLQLAQYADAPLAWISSVAPEPMEQAFLDAYAQHQTVRQITLDWHSDAFAPAYLSYVKAWPEMIAKEDDYPIVADDLFSIAPSNSLDAPTGIALCSAQSIEDEALQGAQTILNWLQQGKTQLAIVAQDRVVARRMRALLERAQVHVADETGWKLSTTRAASALASWFDVITQRGDTSSLLDLLKSPFVLAELPHKATHVMTIETTLRRANVSSGWSAISDALAARPAEQKIVAMLAQQAALFSGRKTLRAWITATKSLDALGLPVALLADSAGQQIMQMLENITPHVDNTDEDATEFSFAEWRALVNLQLDDTSFITTNNDKRVVMLPLNGARMRNFDAVLLVGADADHLPSQPKETLFFANTVRRELGLITREIRQRQQMRDLMELLAMNKEVVLSWQAHKDGEPNPVSPWLERLELTLAQNGWPELPKHVAAIAERSLPAHMMQMPTPVASILQPERLSSSGYSSFIACPYQFFATRMLGLASLDELSDLPEKRDYGGWLHQILQTYHEHLRDHPVPNLQEPREALLRDISTQHFDKVIAKNPAALGYFVRWQKVIAAYVTWANEREAQGWKFILGEASYEKPLALEHGELMLHGRIDRIDENAEGERSVLDYKTNSVVVLNKKRSDDEDHQLAFYGLLSDVPVVSAHYVALETTKDKCADVEAPDYAHAQLALAQKIKQNMQDIANGAPLPANGATSVCQYCDVRGLCRKGAW